MATTHRWFALSVGLVAMLAGSAPALTGELKDPLSPLTSDKGSILCFRRDYSPAHLAQHPKQTTKSVLLAFQEGFVSIVLSQRTGARKVIGAGCGWAQGAGIDTSGHKMVGNFNKREVPYTLLAKFDRRLQRRARKVRGSGAWSRGRHLQAHAHRFEGLRGVQDKERIVVICR